MPAASAAVAVAKPEAQSRVTTGAQLFLDRIDGRSALARRYRDVLAQLTASLSSTPTDAQAILCRRAATLSVLCEQAESALARGGTIDIATYNTSTNTLRRLLQELGLGQPRAPRQPTRRQNGTIDGYLGRR